MTGRASGSPARANGARWVELDEVDSTNSEAMRRAAAGERGVLYIRAERQTAGRGRSGRAWETRGGNLALSRLGAISCPPAAVPQLALVAGVGVHGAIADLIGAQTAAGLRLKWPNDVLLGGAKVAGILVEASTFGADRVAVIGVGINLAHAPDVPGRATTALARCMAERVEPRPAAALVASHIERAIALWDEGRGFAAVRSAWLAASLPAGTRLSVNTGAGSAAGVFGGLDDGGALLIELDNGQRQTFSFGDVALIDG